MSRAAEPSKGSAAFCLATRERLASNELEELAEGQAVPEGAMEEQPFAQELAENGYTQYGWRLVAGQPRLVVVAIGFTVRGLEHEAFDAFQARMMRFAEVLQQVQHPVVDLTLQRRKAQGHRHWAEFKCTTPEADLPRTDGGLGVRG